MNLSRRDFVKTSTVAAIGFPAIVRGRGLNEKLQVAFVGVGGKGKQHVVASYDAGLECVAFADVDKRWWKNVLSPEEQKLKKGEEPKQDKKRREFWKDAAAYTDWREMFAKHGGEIDVLFVTTPDHCHFAPSMTAISMGIHCYTEKPLTWSVREAQLLTEAYKKQKDVVTQMGNHGHGMPGWRLAYEYIKGGAVGDVLEFHTWTNRPVWPQGGDRPEGSSPVPDHLNWDAWVGAAPMRPFVGPGPDEPPSKFRKVPCGAYHMFNWRGFVDFGSGALGDMACHTTDGIYAIMNPGYAASAEPLKMTGPVTDQYPAGMVVKSAYRPAEGRPGFATFWYEGKDENGNPFVPETPEELKADNMKLPKTGNLIVGTEGKMLVTGDYWNTPRIIPDARRREFGRPEQLLERSPGHHEEFFMACRGEKPREFSQSNFSYSGPMTANIQLGNLCARAGKKLVLNEAGEITSDPKINELAWREPRKGWGPIKSVV